MAISPIEEMKHDFVEGVNLSHSNKKRLAQTLLNNAGILIGVFIVFAAIMLVTTEVKFVRPENIGKFAIDFFFLLFCSYSMYVNCSDSGMRFGLKNKDYLKQVEKFESKKRTIIESKNQKKLVEFCRYYINKELENTKKNILAVVGLDYETYVSKWLILNDKQINAITTLTESQKKAIIKANAVIPITLTPEMIMKRGRRESKRAPLGMNPGQRKMLNFTLKFLSNIVVTLFWTHIFVDFVIEPTWELWVAIVLRSLLFILNGYSGYKFGYENIVFDTTNYLSDQTDLMEQAIQYFEETTVAQN